MRVWCLMEAQLLLLGCGAGGLAVQLDSRCGACRCAPLWLLEWAYVRAARSLGSLHPREAYCADSQSLTDLRTRRTTRTGCYYDVTRHEYSSCNKAANQRTCRLGVPFTQPNALCVCITVRAICPPSDRCHD